MVHHREGGLARGGETLLLAFVCVVFVYVISLCEFSCHATRVSGLTDSEALV